MKMFNSFTNFSSFTEVVLIWSVLIGSFHNYYSLYNNFRDFFILFLYGVYSYRECSYSEGELYSLIFRIFINFSLLVRFSIFFSIFPHNPRHVSALGVIPLWIYEEKASKIQYNMANVHK